MNEESYIKTRLDDQIEWYSKKSSQYKYKFYTMRALEIILAGAIPVLFCWSKVQWMIPFLSAIVAILAGLLALFRFHENWISYRTTSESLKHEKYLYLTSTYPYNNEDKLSKLVHNIEQIISSENSLWKQKSLTNFNKD